MNNGMRKEITSIKEEIVGMNKEIVRLNNLIGDIIKEIKSNSDIKIESKDCREIEDILSNCLCES